MRKHWPWLPRSPPRRQTPAFGKSEPVTISPEDLHRQVDGRSLPLTFVEEPY
jgi:hypothetical protein